MDGAGEIQWSRPDIKVAKIYGIAHLVRVEETVVWLSKMFNHSNLRRSTLSLLIDVAETGWTTLVMLTVMLCVDSTKYTLLGVSAFNFTNQLQQT